MCTDVQHVRDCAYSNEFLDDDILQIDGLWCFHLGCLDTLAAMQELKMGVASAEEETQAVMKVYSKEDYSMVNRFESKEDFWMWSSIKTITTQTAKKKNLIIFTQKFVILQTQ